MRERVPDRVVGTVRRVTRVWAVAAVGVLAALTGLTGPASGPEVDDLSRAIGQPLHLWLLGVAVVGGLLAWRFEAAGAVLLAVAGFGLAMVAATTGRPGMAAVVAVGLLVPAVGHWLTWQHRRPRRAVVALGLTTTVLLSAGWVGAGWVHDHYYGPAHDQSPLVALPVDDVEWVWSGAPADDGATVVARLAEGVDPDAEVELVVSSGDGRVRRLPGRPDGDGIARWSVGDLDAGQRYRYVVAVNGEEDRGRGWGRLRTYPDTPSSFTVAFGACARTGSNGAVFDTIRGLDPHLYVATGDLHYGNIGSDDRGEFLHHYDEVLTAPAQAALYREVPVAYIWDDHDYGANDADASSRSRDAARGAYRQAVPHSPLPAGADGPIHQAFTIGRVRFVMTDTRSERTADTMLGAEQLAWLVDELTTGSRTHALVVWVNPDPWIAPADPTRDDWGGYPDERRQIADAIADADVANLVMVSGDAHMVALDDGTNSDYSTTGGVGFPVLHAAALDRPGGVKGGPYSEGTFPGAGQFGTLSVDDRGEELAVELAGYDHTGEELVSHRLTVPAG